MKAQLNNLINQNRQKLQDIIPLTTPMCMHIDVCNICNFKCSFCSVQYSKEKLPFKNQIISKELYEKIIDDCKKFDKKIKVLRLFMNGEPLIHSNFCELVKIAKESNCFEFIEITTNGSLLTPQKHQYC